MTRFARSEGSKSSNRKTVEEATPWEEIKAQMAENAALVQKKKLKEKNEVITDNGELLVKVKKSKKRKAENSEQNTSIAEKIVSFDSSDFMMESESNSQEEHKLSDNSRSKKKKKSAFVESAEFSLESESNNQEAHCVSENSRSKKKKKSAFVDSADFSVASESNNQEGNCVSKKSRSKKKKNCEFVDSMDFSVEPESSYQEDNSVSENGRPKKKKKSAVVDSINFSKEIDSKNQNEKVGSANSELKKKKKSKNSSLEEKQNNFIVEEGKKYKVFKNGVKKPWYELPYKENDYMTRYKTFYVKREMVKVLDDLRKSLEAEGKDQKQIAAKMINSERKAHNQLRLELLRKEIADAKSNSDFKVSKNFQRKLRRNMDIIGNANSKDNSKNDSGNTVNDFVGNKYDENDDGSCNSFVKPDTPSNKNQFFQFEENELMTQYEGSWILKESVEYLNYISDLKVKRIIQSRNDGNTDTELSTEEQLTFRRLMKKEKRREERKLKLKLAEETKQGKSSKVGKKGKPGRYVGIDYAEGIDMTKYDGFWVRTEGAERLTNLKAKLTQNGCSEEEIFNAIKNERRKEERLLTREKKLFCFQCRRVGHLLSSCPEGSNNFADKGIEICFKCGSTEHMARNCHMNKTNSSYTHATCFICGETGHIARECPDNPKGLYPDGGCCRECGSVEHLRRDCPTYVEETKDHSIKLPILDPTQSIDTMETCSDVETEEIVVKKSKPKIVNFF